MLVRSSGMVQAVHKEALLGTSCSRLSASKSQVCGSCLPEKTRKRLSGPSRKCLGQLQHGTVATLASPPSFSRESSGDEAADPVASRGKDSFWSWRGHQIRYQSQGAGGPPIVLIHGFGANCDHWRKNLGPLSAGHRVYAVDLLGYGYSAKPTPGQGTATPYTFETWGAQVNDFAREVVGEPVFLACNSVGGLAGLQAAVDSPSLVRGVVLLNISLRMLHITKQPPLARPAVASLQHLLRHTPLGRVFFRSVATPRAVGNILRECYGDPAAVTPELVDLILRPGLEPGAADVFLDFVSYSGGPLPEDLIPRVQCPVAIGWGELDPWEPLSMGRAFETLPNVKQFVVFPGVGHCPHDEAPDLVNPFIVSFVRDHM